MVRRVDVGEPYPTRKVDLTGRVGHDSEVSGGRRREFRCVSGSLGERRE